MRPDVGTPRPTHVGLLAVAAVAAVAWPLATYTVSLAAFGLAHVLAELRYVDRRFGDRVGDRLVGGLALVLVGLLALGVARNLHALTVPTARSLELAIGLVLVVTVVPTLRRHHRRGMWLAAVAAAALLVALTTSVVHGLLAVAVLHNATPLAFVADATSGPARRRAVRGGLVVFAAVPLLIATGLPFATLHAIGLSAPEASLGFVGPLETHMRAYLPASMLGSTFALHAFSACAFLQCAHYLYVIEILPRTLPAAAHGRVPWPHAWRTVMLGVSVATLVGFVTFGFAPSRRWYGVLAAVHAWVELPLLLLAVVARPAPRVR